jgi:hypothetical protein
MLHTVARFVNFKDKKVYCTVKHHTMPLYILPPQHMQKSLKTEIPYVTAKGIP